MINDRFENKIADLQYIVDTAIIDELKYICETIQKAIVTFNGDIKSRNNAITNYREELKKGGTLAEIRDNNQKLSNLLKRFEDTEKNWCGEYLKAKKDYDDAQTGHAQAKNALTAYSTTVFSEFQIEINAVLGELGTTFHLDSLAGDSNKKSSEAFSEFMVVVNDTASPLQAKDAPSFKSILSEGDKNSLAFAFFVAKLKKSGKIQDSIIVFDDPVSSMDSHRRLQTVRILRDLSQQSKQCLIFSHLETFLFMAWDVFSMSRRAFYIRSDETNGSRVEVFDIEKERRLEQHKRIERLEQYCKVDSGECPRSMQSEMRLCLETQIQFKYFKRLSDEQTLGCILDSLQRQNIFTPDVLKICRDINGVSSATHHGEYETQPLQHLTRQEVVSDIEKLLDVLEKI